MSEPLASSFAPAGPRRPALSGHWALVALLLVALLLLGVFSEQIITWLISAWQRLLQGLGAGHYAESLQNSINGGIAKRLLPAIATYALLYLSTSLLLLYLVLTPAQWRLAWRLYAGTLAAYVLIAALGKLAGNAQWAFRLSRQLLDFVMSPIPVAALYVLLRAGLGPAASRTSGQTT